MSTAKEYLDIMKKLNDIAIFLVELAQTDEDGKVLKDDLAWEALGHVIETQTYVNAGFQQTPETIAILAADDS